MYYRNNSQYKTAVEYYKESPIKDVKQHQDRTQFTHTMISPVKGVFDNHKERPVKDIKQTQPHQDQNEFRHTDSDPVSKNFDSDTHFEVSELEDMYQRTNRENYGDLTEMKLTTKTYKSTSNPSVWGPSFWFTLHNGASKYPVNASKNYQDRMKGFILGIPMMLPCPGCTPHAIAYIESIKPKLDSIVSGRDTLFKFFVDFHNEVNDRYNKKKIGYDEAYKMYRQGVRLTTTNFW